MSMSTIAPEKQDMMIPEAIKLESQLHDDLEYLVTHPYRDTRQEQLQVRTLLIEVQDRIAHLTSLLTF